MYRRFEEKKPQSCIESLAGRSEAEVKFSSDKTRNMKNLKLNKYSHCLIQILNHGHKLIVSLHHQAISISMNHCRIMCVEAKLTRLLQSCTGRAAKAVACCNLMNPEEGNCVETLKALGHDPDIMSDKVTEVVKRLPFHLQNRWRTEAVKYTERNKRYPGFTPLAEFLERASLEVNDPLFQSLDKGLKQNKDRQTTKGTSFNVRLDEEVLTKPAVDKRNTEVSNKNAASCSMCKGKHWLHECSQFIKLTKEKRLMEVRKAKLCFNCLRSNHRVTTCRKATVCEVDKCGMWHHKLLHDAFNKEDASEKAGKVSTQPKVSTKSCACNPSKDSKIALPIVKVKVGRLGMDNHISTLALLDPGSNSTFCTKALIDKLGISGKSVTLNMTTLNKVEDTEVEEITLEMVTGGRKKQTIVLEKVYALKDFPPSLQGGVTSQVDVKNWRHLESLELPNVNAEVVSIVIGQDYPHLLKPQEVRSGKDNEPYAIRTVLGWAINGPVGDDPHSKEVFNNLIHTIPTSESSLSIQVEKFWAIDGCEDLNKNTSCMSKDDKEVLSLWDKSVVKINGHFQLPIPFKRNPPELCNNRSMVDKRQESLKKRLIKNPALLDEYNKEIMKLVTKGQAEVVPDEEIDAFPGLTWYLPIFNVKNEKKPEKFRLVFDCAAEFMGTSLNKHVLQGPDLTNKLFGILQRFRKEKVAIMSDIEAMYYQVKVTPSHKCFRFLWWTDGDLSRDPEIMWIDSGIHLENLEPKRATYALLHTANDQKDNFDERTFEIVHKNFYVDDLLTSTETEEEAVNLRRSIASMLKTGGFKLTKWTSNNECRLQKGWDDHLSEEGMKRWTRWLLDMEHLKDINIERSKSRLAPMKSTTTPRLELAAATTAVKIDEALHQELGLELIESTFWTDSMIVIQYIKSQSKRFKTFVANRANFENQKKNGYHELDESIDFSVDDIEVKKVPKSIAAVSQVAEDVTDKFHELLVAQLKKAVVWMRRFGQWLPRVVDTFQSHTIYKLRTRFLDNTSRLRVGGRLHQAPVSEETRHPVIVPRQHEIAKLIAKESHETTGHSVVVKRRYGKDQTSVV
ncbi:uncharacterized protein LOC122263440 [Penaeus japonicus]|uniref:uncharacterized protein LOC122263440 n=1 Tax=Penaeus japonicus TaxID=27405 RepID=UPI001C7140D5|nr:uncharacterized protein LOC122263440 [Penaeus japonicus]